MFENVLEVGERPSDLIVYASLGKAARNWEEAVAIVEALVDLRDDETLILQSGALIGRLHLGPGAPAVLSAVNNTVGHWATAERFYERAARGDTIWGGLTAAAWQYIGRQGVLQGTYELFKSVALRHFGGRDRDLLVGRWVLTAGLGGMGSAQPISARMLGLSSLTVEVDPSKLARAHDNGGVDRVTDDLDTALEAIRTHIARGEPIAVGLRGNAADAFPAIRDRGFTPDIVTDQTSAHDPRFGYLPAGVPFASWTDAREADPVALETAARASMATQVAAMLDLQARGSVVFENGNNLRVQALMHLGTAETERVNRIPGFMAGYLRPLFARGIGPFRWVCLSGDQADQAVMDDLVVSDTQDRPEVAEWLTLARQFVPQQGLPARSCWLGHGERGRIAAAANRLVADGTLTAPVLFSRDHLDSAGMTHPRIGTEGMWDRSDGVSDWPILDAMVLAASGADLVAVHSGGGGYAGWMQSAGVSVIVDGSADAGVRAARVLDADTGLGVLRHATAGYPEARDQAAVSDLRWESANSRPSDSTRQERPRDA